MGCIAWKRKKILESKWTLRFLVIAVLFPEIANQLGWDSAEMGRQPWVVHGLLLTKEGLSPGLQAAQVLFSLILFSIIYCVIFILFIYLMHRKIQRGPDGPDGDGIEEYRHQMYTIKEEPHGTS